MGDEADSGPPGQWVSCRGQRARQARARLRDLPHATAGLKHTDRLVPASWMEARAKSIRMAARRAAAQQLVNLAAAA